MIPIDSPELWEGIGVARLEVELRAKEEARLPRFLGSTLRGALARSTRRISCALRNERCERCLLRHRCVYSVLFETPRPDDSELLRGQAKVPHPLVIDPPPPGESGFAAGDSLRFAVTLFDQAVDHVPHLVVAIDDAASRGLGSRSSPFELVRVEAVDSSGARRTVHEPGGALAEVEIEPLNRLLADRPVADEVTLELLTPTRLVSDGRLTRRPALPALVRSLAFRALAMLHVHAGVEADLDVVGLTELAEGGRIEGSDLRLVRLSRHSSRQKRTIPLDGVVGRITYVGEPVKALFPLLHAGEVLRAGKGTIFGLGRYRIVDD